MDLELVKALLTILRYCTSCENCKVCALKDFCRKIPTEW